MPSTRRALLFSIATFLGAACARPQPRSGVPTPSVDAAEINQWDAEARAILAEALGVLRTYEAYAAYRISVSERSPMRTPRELEWDPPTPTEWSSAGRLGSALHVQSARLYETVSRSTPDTSLWRERRRLAAAAHALADMSDALTLYHEAVRTLEAQSDGGSALPHLHRAWNRWQASAAHWGVERAEALGCA